MISAEFGGISTCSRFALSGFYTVEDGLAIERQRNREGFTGFSFQF